MEDMDRTRLTTLLVWIRELLQFVVERVTQRKRAAQLHDQIHGAWTRVQERIDGLKEALARPTSQQEEELREAGLAGSELALKHDLFQSLWDRFQKQARSNSFWFWRRYRNFLFPGFWRYLGFFLLDRLFALANSFLGSLAKAFPPAEAIAEFKELMEVLVDDA